MATEKTIRNALGKRSAQPRRIQPSFIIRESQYHHPTTDLSLFHPGGCPSYRDYCTLDGLNGDSFSVQDRFAKWDEVFREMKPVCPQCGSKLTDDNIER